MKSKCVERGKWITTQEYIQNKEIIKFTYHQEESSHHITSAKVVNECKKLAMCGALFTFCYEC
jgi:hypothetical protein